MSSAGWPHAAWDSRPSRRPTGSHDLEESLAKLERAIVGPHSDTDCVVKATLELYRRRVEAQRTEIKTLRRAVQEARADAAARAKADEALQELAKERARGAAVCQEAASLRAGLEAAERDLQAEAADHEETQQMLRSARAEIELEKGAREAAEAHLAAARRQMATERQWRQLALTWFSSELSIMEDMQCLVSDAQAAAGSGAAASSPSMPRFARHRSRPRSAPCVTPPPAMAARGAKKFGSKERWTTKLDECMRSFTEQQRHLQRAMQAAMAAGAPAGMDDGGDVF